MLINVTYLNNIIPTKQGLREQPAETLAAITHELRQMLRLEVFKPIDHRALNPDQRSKVIYSSMFLKHKYTPQGVFVKCKARLVAGGNLQDKSLYANTSSPTASPTAILVTAGLAAKDNMKAATICKNMQSEVQRISNPNRHHHSAV